MWPAKINAEIEIMGRSAAVIIFLENTVTRLANEEQL
jgi:hypothetical protein